MDKEKRPVNVCAHGLHDYCVRYRKGDGCEEGTKKEVNRAEVERAKAYLSLLTGTRTIGKRTPSSYGLKHQAERMMGAYISNGALIAAADELGLLIVPICHGSDATGMNADIGVSLRDIRKLQRLYDDGRLPILAAV
jgi:hypothetical protein